MDVVEESRKELERVEPVELLIGGVPGTLKTSTSLLLGAMLRVPVVSTDHLRAVQRMYDDSPWLAGETHTRWQLLGAECDYLLAGVEKQSRLVREAVHQISDESFARGQHQIFEGVHLLPELYPPKLRRLHVLLRDLDPQNLRSRMQGKFPARPELAGRWTTEKIAQLMRIQESLVESAERQGVMVVDATTPEAAAELIVGGLRRALESWGRA